MNHNGTKVVWKEAWSYEMESDQEMEGMTPLMLAIQFLRGYSAYMMVNELMMSDNSTGNQPSNSRIVNVNLLVLLSVRKQTSKYLII